MKQMKTRHSNNIVSAMTGFARRALLLVSFLLLGLGSTWGEENKLPLTCPWGNSYYTVDASVIQKEFGETTEVILRVYGDNLSKLYIAAGNEPFYGWGTQSEYETSHPEWNPAGFFEFTLNSQIVTKLKNNGLSLEAKNAGEDIDYVTWEKYEKPPLDISAPIYYKGREISGLTYEFSLIEQASLIKGALGGKNVKYAKWYIADSDDSAIPCENWRFTQGAWNTDNPIYYRVDYDGEGYAWDHQWSGGFDLEGDQNSRKENVLEMTITAPDGTDLTGKKVVAIFSSESAATSSNFAIQAICVFEFLAPDVFSGKAKSTCDATGLYITKYIDPVNTLAITLNKEEIALAIAKLPNGEGVKYARFYLLHDGELVNLKSKSSLLTIEDVKNSTGEIVDWQLPARPTYGYYFYDNGQELDLSGANMTLTVEAGTFPEYEVVCVLSTDATDAVSGTEVITEPDWDVVFTYAFRNQVETKDQTGSVTWDAVAMTATIPTDDMAEKWGTSWSNLAQEQKIQWYVTDDSGNQQPLVIGTERKMGTWAIDLPAPFTTDADGKAITLTGQTMYNAASFENMWETWGNPALYAPADKGFADAKDYKIVCEIADDPESTEPNVIYTLSIDKTQFAGQEKTTIVKTTQQVKLGAGAKSASIPLNLPEETKYVRFYVVGQNGANVDEPWVNEGIAIYGREVTGKYMYDEQGLSLNNITIGSNSGNLNEYQVIMVTSTEKANLSQYEPDYDTQTTFWFKYPVEDKDKWKPTAEVDWSPQSMQIVAPNIDMQGDVAGEKGAGYLEKNRQHYTLEWTVVDQNGDEQLLRIGDSRVDDYWSFNIIANPFTVADDGKSLVASNDPNLNVITWNSWAGPQIFAPKNMTMKQIADAGIKFVCKLYEDDEAGDDKMLAMTYTINIVRKEELGQLKDGGIYYEKIIEDITHTQTSFTFDSSEPLQNAITAFQKEVGKEPTYVRIYLTRNDGAPLHPGEEEDENEQLIIENTPLFEKNPKYGYYFHNENGVDLSDITATLKLPAGSFTYYNVAVAMSADTDKIDFSGDFYEPDYDYIYAFKFVETSSFPGTLVESLITHAKEMHVKTGDTEVLIPLNETNTISEFLYELGETGGFSDMAKNYYHVRWFVAKKNDDGTYEKLANSEGMLNAVAQGMEHKIRRNQGIYWNHDCVPQGYNNFYDDILKVNFTKPMDGNWSDYQVVVWMTNSNDGAAIGTDGALSHEPDIKIQYIYSFVEEEIAPDLPFVHYQGEAYRYLKEKGEDIAAQQRDYMTLDGDAWLQEYTWNAATSNYEPISGNIRQSVHTWEYDIYVVPGETRPLMLPFQFYDSINQWGGSTDDGNDDEPRAYIRWYDWNTDTKVIGDNFVFDKTENSQLSENDRGLFGLCVPNNPIHKRVGVTFTPNADFTKTFDVACDVSKYSDGIVNINGKYHLLHEPTLSSRYIFHIHPASEIADSLEKARQRYETAESTGDAKTLYDAMSTLKEDKGKVVVSITDEKTEFSLRYDLQYLSDYIIYSEDKFMAAENAKWLVYFEDENGFNTKELSVPTKQFGDTGKDCEIDPSKRIFTFKYETFKKIGNGKRFHMVGFVKSDTYEAPVAHYELEFMEAPPVPLSKILSNATDDKIKYKERMESYMSLHYEVKGVVDFDGNPETNENIKKNPYEALYYYSTPNWDSEPTSSLDNISYVPFPWDDIQYGFCYPQLTSTVRNGYYDFNMGPYVTPEHSDYTILKTMKVDKISNGNEYHLWAGVTDPFYDYTYHATINNEERPTQYGSFLYTDASDESRSIATIPFTADLCSGSAFYFTAVVANLTETTGHVAPQLLIRIVGIKDDGTRERIVAFHTAKLDNENVKVSLGQWYQVYAASTLSKDFDTSITRFEAEVINYANGTLGADFAIDQIVIYTSTSKVLLTQTGDASCTPDVDDARPDRVKAFMEADGLQNAFGISDELQPICWRICDKSNGEVVMGVGMYPRYKKDGSLIEDNGTFTYGVTWVKSKYSSDDFGLINEAHPYGWYHDNATDKDFFQIADKTFDALEEGKDYYVSVFDPTILDPKEFDPVVGNGELNKPELWGGLEFGARDRCSIYSEFFVPRRQYVTYTYGKNGTEGGEISVGCGSGVANVEGVQIILKVPSKIESTGFKSIKDFHYDFAFVPLSTWKSQDATFEYNGEEYKYAELNKALTDYRASSIYEGKYSKTKGLDEDYESDNSDYYNLLDCAIKAGILKLACSLTFEYKFDEIRNYAITCIPVERMVTIEDLNDNDEIVNKEVEICAPFEVTFKLKSSGGPSLTLGFEGVDYEGHGNIRVVRVGLGQIKNMQSDGYLLHIPVNKFMTDVDDDETLNTGALTIVSEKLELLRYNASNVASNAADDTWTNDPEVGAGNIDVATFDGWEISASRKYISLDFQGITSSETYKGFKEGFTYRMFFQVKDKDAGEGACEVSVEFLMKVVPEYVTWNDKATTGDGAVTPNTNVNANWNNDKNWSRSRKAELHKTETNSDDYKNNGTETGDNRVASTPATFVPMKFTYVTIPSGNRAPVLEELTIGDDGIYTAKSMGVGATENIQYDLMVKVENECEHDAVSSVYDCEKFYGNWAKEIYFKPGAELVNQHYLTYEKVWVEKELAAGTWTLMSTPLQNTYAGDMYVPTDGQQTTEAFQPIKMTNETGALLPSYSRTAYPIYQKSWLQEGSKVYTMTNDVQRTDYSANIVESVATTLSQWSHTYNDVTVDYSQWKGFAVRAHKSDYTGTRKNALLRLPKEDTQYEYYKWDGKTTQDPAAGDDVKLVNKKATDNTHLATGKLFTDKTPNTYGLTYGVDYQPTANATKQSRTANDGTVKVKIGEVQDAKDADNNYYLLVGNPYLCSIDMESFFGDEGNKDILEEGYWTYEHNAIDDSYTKGSIKPMQSFFVKLKNGVTDGNEEIQFTPAMMMDGNTNSITPEARAMMMTAANNRGQSSATVSVGEEAMNVETLFDSNLSDVPMVYTVADGQAVSINQVVELSRPIAFGVTCTASNEPLAVTFSDIAQLTSGEVYVVDAVMGEQTLVTEGSTLSVQPNDYGRYFLLAGTMGISDKTGVQKGIVVSVRGKEVTVTSVEALTLVRAFSPSGATVYQNTTGGTSKSFILGSGVYIIQAENAGGEQKTAKVVLKTE